MPVTFSGINILAKDPVKSFEFYRGIGLSVKTGAAPDDQWYGAEFDLGGGALLVIWRDHGEGAQTPKRPSIQIFLHCDDIGQTYEDLKLNGYDASQPELMFYGGKEMNLTDPDGNSILFLD